MTWTSKKIFKATDSVSSKITIPTLIGEIQDLTQAPTAEPVSPAVVEDIQDQIDDITDSIESKYVTDYVFDQFDYFISTHPFYFHWEIPLGTVEIVSARVSFEVKDYRNESLTDSRYAITGDSTDRPVITFYVSEDKGHLFRDVYGPYETDMRAIDISGDLTGEGIKVIKFETDNDVCVTARVFLRVKINKDLSGTIDDTTDSISERPEVRTLAATSTLELLATTFNGDIVSVGKGGYTDRSTGEIIPVTCTKRGFKYGLTKTDTWDMSESATYVKGKYGISVTGLTPETDYYFRAYADNQVGRSYGEYMKVTTPPRFIAYIYYDSSDSNANHVAIFNMQGELITDVKYSSGSYAGYGDTIAVDKDNNIFIAGRWSNKILKLSSVGVELLEVTASTPRNLALDPDGYIWCNEYDDDWNWIFAKRNATTLEIEDSFIPSGESYMGMAFDSDGYLYTIDWYNKVIEKWNVATHTKVAYRALAGGAEDNPTYSSLTIMGDYVTLVSWASSQGGDDYFICPTDLSSDFVASSLAEFPGELWTEVVKTYGDNYILCGDIDVNLPAIEEGQTIIRYDSSFDVVWQIFYDAQDGGMSVNAYPF